MKYKFLHIGLHDSLNKNAGDTLLFDLVRKTFEKFFFNVEWDLKQLWDPISENDIEAINKKYHGIILGGGGVRFMGFISSRRGGEWSGDVLCMGVSGCSIVQTEEGRNGGGGGVAPWIY